MANKRLIDANALFEKMEHTSTDVCADYGDGFCEHGYSTQLLRLMVSETPTVDAVEVVHGKWIEKIDMVESYLADSTEVFYECSVCECANIGESPYCPNCGAKMDGGNEDA